MGGGYRANMIWPVKFIGGYFLEFEVDILGIPSGLLGTIGRSRWGVSGYISAGSDVLAVKLGGILSPM